MIRTVRSMRPVRGFPFWGLALALLVLPARAQSPEEVRIDITSGMRRIRIHCEALTPAGDRSPRVPSVQADEVLANDLDHSAVFTVSRGWVQGERPFDVQGVISGRCDSSSDSITCESHGASRFPLYMRRALRTVMMPAISERSRAVSTLLGAKATRTWQFETMLSFVP